MTLFYTDVANVNWPPSRNPQDVINFLQGSVAEGFSGVAHKVTQGAGFQDWAWQTAFLWCRSHQYPIIGYHYVDLSDPAAQASNYVNAGGTDNVMLDWENGGGDLNNFWSVVEAFNMRGFNIQLGYVPRWYLQSAGSGAGTDISAFAANGIKLVSSAYPNGYAADLASNIYQRDGGDSGPGWASYNGGTPAAWQFTSVAQVSGFVVDCNAFLGDNITDLFGAAA
jgi:hypothetical protein